VLSYDTAASTTLNSCLTGHFWSYSRLLWVPQKRIFQWNWSKPEVVAVTQSAASKHWRELKALMTTSRNHPLGLTHFLIHWPTPELSDASNHMELDPVSIKLWCYFVSWLMCIVTWYHRIIVSIVVLCQHVSFLPIMLCCRCNWVDSKMENQWLEVSKWRFCY